MPDSTVRLARERALVELEGRIRAIPAGSSPLGDWISASADRDRAFRGLVWSLPTANAPQWICDDLCLVRMEIEQAALQRAMDSWAEREAAPTVIYEAFPGGALVAIGAARKGAGPPDLLEDRAQLARQAAAMSACRELLDQIRRLKLTATQRVSSYLDAEERRDAQLLIAIRESARIDPAGGDDAVAHASASLGMDQVIVLMTRHARARGGESPDFIALADLNPIGELRAFGWATPPSVPPLRYSVPARRAPFFGQTLRVNAYVPIEVAVPPLSGEIPVEAMLALDEALRRIPFREATVGSYMFMHTDREPHLEALLAAALMVERIEACEDGGQEWTVSIDLRWLAELAAES